MPPHSRYPQTQDRGPFPHERASLASSSLTGLLNGASYSALPRWCTLP